MLAADTILFSGGAPGAETRFGEIAEQYGVEEVNFTFDGHPVTRTRGIRVLNHEELQQGDVSRTFPHTDMFRKILQTIWFQVNNGQEIYVIGTIQADDTVKGGTGWGAEFAKICNKPLFVFDQDRDGWFTWSKDHWTPCTDAPVITHAHFTGTGTRNLAETGAKAIEDLFARSFPTR
jgi:hypothetical protein